MTDEKGKRKSKSKEEKNAKVVKFPVDSKINSYGFIFMKKSWLEALGWQKGIALKIERNADDSITVRKT